MRKNTQEVFKAWLEGKACKPSKSIWTDGGRIFSYQATLVEPTGMFSGRNRVSLNFTMYSRTTREKQNSLLALLNRHNYDVAVFGG